MDLLSKGNVIGHFCVSPKAVSQPRLPSQRSVVLAKLPMPGVHTIQIHAIMAANSDGQNSALTNHPDVIKAEPNVKYRIEKEDISRLVEGANLVYAPAKIQFKFDPTRDLDVVHDTLVNQDSLSATTHVSTQHVFYCGADKHIYELWAGEDWYLKNISDEASAPAASGSPAVYMTAASASIHVVYRGTDGHIHELFAGNVWQHASLTIQTSAPQAAGDPFGFTTFDTVTGQMDVQHIVYKGVDGHIHELFTADNEWRHNILTIQAKAPQAAGDPFGYISFHSVSVRQAVQHVVYRGIDDHIHELFAGETWQHTNLTSQADGPKAAGNPVAYTTNYGNVQHVTYRGTDGHIHELFAGDHWQHNNLTVMTGASQASGDPVGYLTNDYGFGVADDQHIVYRGVDGHIHELFTVDSWHHNDLTKAANVPHAASDPSAYTDVDRQTQHVVFRDIHGQVHELFSGSEWVDNNLTQRTGAPLATHVPVGLSKDADDLCDLMRNRIAKSYPGKLVVYFRYGGGGWSNSVDEFVIMPSIWNPNDLNFLAHEIGHYLHLGHTFSGLSQEQSIAYVRSYVEDLAKSSNHGQLPSKISPTHLKRGLEAVDSDRPYIMDTPAEVNEHAAKIKVTFSTGQSQSYQFEDDLLNAMNYQAKAGNTARFSNEQIARMRHALEAGNRQHLL